MANELISIIDGGSLDLNKKPQSICALGVSGKPGVCSQSDQLRLFKQHLKDLGYTAKSDEDVVKKLIEHYKVESEADLYNISVIKGLVGRSEADRISKELFLPEGPHDSTALLDNFNIDESLIQWSKTAPKIFKKRFYHIPFQMIDFAETGSELSKLDVGDLANQGYDCFGVIMNTDLSTGRGIHWFCLYGDLAHKGTKEDPYVIEYFNSSGNPPRYQVTTWMENTKAELLRDYKKHCKIRRSIPIRIQKSQTECGVWSLIYIKCRLMGYSPNIFYKQKTTDGDVIDHRKHLFR
jgi:hypothetical protein